MKKISIFLFIAFMILCVLYYYSSKQVYTVKITGKERVTYAENNKIESIYLIYTDKGVFSLKDEMILGNFYSSDLYGKIKNDSIYTIEVIGVRVPVLNMYQNIIKLNNQKK